MNIVNEAALVAGQKSLTDKPSQESVYYSQSENPLSKLAVEQHQKQITLKDQEIARLRSQIEQYSSDFFTQQQENDSLNFNKSQL